MGHIGSNLNQIAKAANSGDGIDLLELGRAIGAIMALKDAGLKALGRRT